MGGRRSLSALCTRRAAVGALVALPCMTVADHHLKCNIQEVQYESSSHLVQIILSKICPGHVEHVTYVYRKSWKAIIVSFASAVCHFSCHPTQPDRDPHPWLRLCRAQVFWYYSVLCVELCVGKYGCKECTALSPAIGLSREW